MENNLKIGDIVKKKSGKPFKNGSTYQEIINFGINEKDPKQRLCAIFSDGSVCNLDKLNSIIFIDVETSITVEEKIVDTLYPVTYFNNGITVVDYPNNYKI
jgi:hypothetical protein